VPRLAQDARVTLVDSLEDVLDLRAWLGERRDWLGCDIETTGLTLGRDEIRLFQLGDLRRGWALPWDDWRGAVKAFLPSYRGRIVFHNSAFDLAFLDMDGVHVPQVQVDDTMVMAHLINPAGRIGLKPLAAKLVGPEALLGKDDLTDAFKAGGWDFGTIPVDHPAYYVYSAMDTMLTAALAEELWPTIEEKYREIYDIEMGCIQVLVPARIKGMAVDLDYVARTRAQYVSDLEHLRVQIPCEPSKDRQIRDLFDARGREMGRGPLGTWWPFRTEKGEVSVDDDALKAFHDDFPDIMPPLREWRKKSRLVSAYLNNILTMNVDSVLRCNIRTLAARTGRMSITEPALQTLPRGRAIRDAFVARDGHKIVQADYKQAELRVFAWYAQCRPMIEAFQRDEDLHSWVAAQVYANGDMSGFTKLQRQISKNVQFARIYGAGPAKIAATAGVEVEAIEDFMRQYNNLFPEAQEFMQGLMGQMHQRLREGEAYVTTRLGRRLVVDRDKLYSGLNYLIQSTATSDVIKLKLCELDAAGLGEYIRLPIHDEILFEAPDEDVDDLLETIRRVMPERQLFGDCPLEIDTDVLSRWGDHYPDPAPRPQA